MRHSTALPPPTSCCECVTTQSAKESEKNRVNTGKAALELQRRQEELIAQVHFLFLLLRGLACVSVHCGHEEEGSRKCCQSEGRAAGEDSRSGVAVMSRTHAAVLEEKEERTRVRERERAELERLKAQKAAKP